MTAREIIIPSLGLHTSLSALTYAASRLTGRLEGKDYLWPSGLVLNAWYHAVLRHLGPGISLGMVMRRLDGSQRLVLGGVTLWGGRLFYRIVKRSVQRGRDDPRYDHYKTPSSWNTAFFSKFLPEAVVQTIIGLAWSIPLNGALKTQEVGAPREYAGILHASAVGLYTVGLSLEVLADWQLERNKGKNELQRSGVWSIVRHPKYVLSPAPTSS
jgi:steroid 5-alpha reductase family enzyme